MEHNKKIDELPREEAIDELQQESVASFYLGLLHDDDGEKSVQYRISTDTDDLDTVRKAGSAHLGLLMKMLSAQSGLDVEEVAEIGIERAKEIDSL